MKFLNLKAGETISGFINGYIDGPYGRQYIIKNNRGTFKLPTHQMLVKQLPAFEGKNISLERINKGSRKEAVIYKIRVIRYTSLDDF